jgi:hypothetical protein
LTERTIDVRGFRRTRYRPELIDAFLAPLTVAGITPEKLEHLYVERVMI